MSSPPRPPHPPHPPQKAIQNNLDLQLSWLRSPSASHRGTSAPGSTGVLSCFEYSVVQQNPWDETTADGSLTETTTTSYFPPTGAIRQFRRYNANPSTSSSTMPYPQALSGVTNSLPSKTSQKAIDDKFKEGYQPPPSYQPPAIQAAANLPDYQPPLTPGRKRNKDNAIYGQLPTTSNSPAIALRVFGSGAADEEVQRRYDEVTDGESAGHRVPPPKVSRAEDELNMFDRAGGAKKDEMFDDDDMFVDFDPDAFVQAEKTKSAQTTTTKTTTTTSSMGAQYNQQSYQQQPPQPQHRNQQQQYQQSYQAQAPSNNYESNSSTNPTYTLNVPTSYYGSSPLCVCGHPCDVRTAGDQSKNPGREFYVCPKPRDDRDESCADFFQWVDGMDSGPSFAPNEPDPNAPNCNCNEQCLRRTAATEGNQGRPFYVCPKEKDTPDNCGFFTWADEISGAMPGQFMDHSAQPTTPIHGRATDIKEINLRQFGHAEFRDGQEGIIRASMQGRDVFVLMPTGGGKSLCYQLPAVASNGLAVVVSPLISLMVDQVENLKLTGVKAEYLASVQSYPEQNEILDRVKNNPNVPQDEQVKLLYVTPERLNASGGKLQSVLNFLQGKAGLSNFVIDEAHCLSQWGHDFRKDYIQGCRKIRETYPGVPTMALTATANEKVVQEAIGVLRLNNPYRYKSTFNRPNLHYTVEKKGSDAKCIESICKYVQKKGLVSGIIYCQSKKSCEDVAKKLTKFLGNGPRAAKADFYHADVSDQERRYRHEAWSQGRIHILCATVAFGMGIDKPDVRFVIHFTMPQSITHYYQESGRAGRDGNQADCIMYYAYKDKITWESMMKDPKGRDKPPAPVLTHMLQQLYNTLDYCEDEFACRRALQLKHFGEIFDKDLCNKTCDNCRGDFIKIEDDRTEVGLEILKLADECVKVTPAASRGGGRGRGVTKTQLGDLYRGLTKSSEKVIFDLSPLTMVGAGKTRKLNKDYVDKTLTTMVVQHYLVENSEQNSQGFRSSYTTPGHSALKLSNGQERLKVYVKDLKAGAKAKKAASPKKATPTKKKSAKKESEVITLDDVVDDDDDFMYAAAAVPDRINKKQQRSDILLDDVQCKELCDELKSHCTKMGERESTRIMEMPNPKNEVRHPIRWYDICNGTKALEIAKKLPLTFEEFRNECPLPGKKTDKFGEEVHKRMLFWLKGNDLYDQAVAWRKQDKLKKKAKKNNSSEVVDLCDSDNERSSMGFSLTGVLGEVGRNGGGKGGGKGASSKNKLDKFAYGAAQADRQGGGMMGQGGQGGGAGVEGFENSAQARGQSSHFTPAPAPTAPAPNFSHAAASRNPYAR